MTSAPTQAGRHGRPGIGDGLYRRGELDEHGLIPSFRDMHPRRLYFCEHNHYGRGRRDWRLKCPCGEREGLLLGDRHAVTFDEDGLCTVHPSLGYEATDEHPANWCHYFIRQGRVEMCGDARCPGAEMQS